MDDKKISYMPQNAGDASKATMPHDLAGLVDKPFEFDLYEDAYATNKQPPGPDPASLIRPLETVERETIENAIRVCHGNIPMAAVYLGLSPSTIYRKKALWQKNPDDPPTR